MPRRTGEATWEGTLREGEGRIELESGAYKGPYSFSSRFEDGTGTNPEELIGGAEAGCFSMALALMLQNDGYEPDRIDTEAIVHLDETNGDFTITTIELNVEAVVPEIDEGTFVEYATDAKEGCPVSKALAGPEINLTATLHG